MTEKPELSRQAKKLLDRIRQGKFYRPWQDNLPAAMEELVEAGLVAEAGRVTVIQRCYVPATGYTPYVPEKYNTEEN